MIHPSPLPIRLFSSDLDGTFLGNPESAQQFKQSWDGLKEGKRPLLVLNSGRRVKDTRDLIKARRLPLADCIIGGAGTELHDFHRNRDEPDFNAQFGEG